MYTSKLGSNGHQYTFQPVSVALLQKKEKQLDTDIQV